MSELLAHSPFDPAIERRIVIIADWLPPDFGAVGQYMSMRARSLAERGHDVTLVGLASGPGSKRRTQMGRGSLHEVRLAARPVPRASMLRRLLWTLSTDIRLVAAAFGSLRRADGILFTGSPPFLIHLLAPLKRLWSGRLIYRITDFHPECLIAARERPSKMLDLLLGLTNFWRRKVDGFEVLGEDQLDRLHTTGVARERIVLVRDGSPISFDNAAGYPVPPELAGHCVLLYSGNYGVAHEVDTVARGYLLHHREGSGRVHLWLSATGVGAETLVARFNEDSLPYYRSPPVALEQLAGLLLAPDAHLVTLKDRFVGFVMPSKIYACLKSRRPIVFVGSLDSDVDQLARRSGAGYWQVPCGDAMGFAAALEALAASVQKNQKRALS